MGGMPPQEAQHTLWDATPRETGAGDENRAPTTALDKGRSKSNVSTGMNTHGDVVPQSAPAHVTSTSAISGRTGWQGDAALKVTLATDDGDSSSSSSSGSEDDDEDINSLLG